MSLSPHLAKRTLDWMLGGAAAADITERWVGLVDHNGTELGIAGYSRLTASFAPAASPNVSASLAQTLNFGPYDGDGTARTIILCDAPTGGNVLAQTVRTSDLLFSGGGGVIIRTLELILA